MKNEISTFFLAVIRKKFRYGDYDEQFAAELKPFITNLNMSRGVVTCEKALKMASF